jgi:Domain of unknown function (DUF1924)
MSLSRAALVSVALVFGCGIAMATSGRLGVLDHYAALARQENPQFQEFSAAQGRAFFLASPGAGEAGIASCTSCHTNDPHNQGRTRAGKLLDPMAVSRTPTRFTDLEKVEKWFSRNCQTVYGRPCTAVEKGNFIGYMATQ